MTTATLTRSTLAISQFVIANRKLVAKQIECKQFQAEMDRLTDTVLAQIGSGRTVNVDGVVTLTPRVQTTVIMLNKLKALEYWREHGLKISTQEPEYVHHSSFRAEVSKGSVPKELYSLETTIGVNVI